jgi:hypothetical protein
MERKTKIILIALLLVILITLVLFAKYKQPKVQTPTTLKQLNELCNRSDICAEGLECYPYDNGICISKCPIGYQRYNETLCMPGV